jgi:hypothetical protein
MKFLVTGADTYYMSGMSFVIYGKPAIGKLLGVKAFVREGDLIGEKLRKGIGKEIAERRVINFLKYFIPDNGQTISNSSPGIIRNGDWPAIIAALNGASPDKKTPAEFVRDMGRNRGLPLLGTHAAALSEIIASAGADPESGPDHIVLSETNARYLFQRTDDEGQLLLSEAIIASNNDFLNCFTKSRQPGSSWTIEFVVKNGREPALARLCALLQEKTGINYAKNTEGGGYTFDAPPDAEPDFKIALTMLTRSYLIFPHILPEYLKLIYIGIVGELEKTQGG